MYVKNRVKLEMVMVGINPNHLVLIETLIETGYYKNRSDFIREAVREKLEKLKSTGVLKEILDLK